MRIIACTLLFLMLLAGSALAQMSDDDYVDQYFGTQVVITTAERPYNYDGGGWWAESLPDPLYNYDSSYIAGVVNAGRIATGETELLDDPNGVLMLGYEIELENGFQYDISFRGVRPSEVKTLFKALSMPETVLDGASVEFRPLMSTTYSFYGSTDGAPMMVSLGELKFPLEMDMAATDLHDRFVDYFLTSLGKDVLVDIYYGQSLGQYGNTCDLSVTATINE